jgi:hypothetical protein
MGAKNVGAWGNSVLFGSILACHFVDFGISQFLGWGLDSDGRA